VSRSPCGSGTSTGNLVALALFWVFADRLPVTTVQIIDEMIRMQDEDNCTIDGDGDSTSTPPCVRSRPERKLVDTCVGVGEQVVEEAAGGCVDVDATLCGL
jgi:hypothetical protein